MGKEYYGELVLGVVVKSKLEFEKFKSMFEEDGLRGELKLRTLDKLTTDAKSLEVYSADWEKV